MRFRDDNGLSLLLERDYIVDESFILLPSSFSSENNKNNENDVHDDESKKGERFIERSEEKRNTASAVGGKDEDEKDF